MADGNIFAGLGLDMSNLQQGLTAFQNAAATFAPAGGVGGGAVGGAGAAASSSSAPARGGHGGRGYMRGRGIGRGHHAPPAGAGHGHGGKGGSSKPYTTIRPDGVKVTIQRGGFRGRAAHTLPVQGPGRNTNTLMFTNPANLSREELVAALRTQCPDEFTVTEYLVGRDTVHLTLSQNDSRAINSLVRLSGSLLAKGQKIAVTRPRNRPQGMHVVLHADAEGALQSLMQARFDLSTQTLNLTAILPVLAGMGMCAPDSILPSLWDAMGTIITKNCPALTVLDVSSNNITTLTPLRAVFEACPNLTLLNLQGNAIKSLDDLTHLRTLTLLSGVAIAGNPCAVNRQTLEGKMRKFVPSLVSIDGAPLAPTADQMLPPIQPQHVPDVVGGTLQGFGVKYFTLFDTDRLPLLNCYTPTSTFSLTAPVTNSGALRDAMKFARNLYKNVGRNRIYTGASAIVKLLQDLPRTQHDMDSFSVDVWRLSDTELCFNITGHMSASLSFYRVFVLEPALPGSTAATQGWPAVVVSDMLHIQPRSGAAGGGGAAAAAAGGKMAAKAIKGVLSQS